MSDLDLKGNIDIATSAATNNLNNLANAAEKLQAQLSDGSISAGDYAKAMSQLATATDRNAKVVTSALDSMGRAEVSASKIATEESRRRIAERKSEADAAKQTGSQIIAALKAQEAAEKQYIARQRSTTSNPATTGGATVNRNLASALGQEDDPQTAQLKKLNDYYRKLETDAIASAERTAAARAEQARKGLVAEELAARTAREGELAAMRASFQEGNRLRLADAAESERIAKLKAQQNRQALVQEQRDAESIRKNELAAMRANATESLGLPDVGSLNQTRYALYDVSTTLGVLGAGLTAAGSSALVFGARYESAFTQVERTSLPTMQQAASLRQELQELSETIPVGFEQLSGIAALGAQMNIANDDLAQFADTTARYAAVTGISTESAATSFGALFELTNTGAGQMENLTSAINYVGVTSVATDSEILSLAQNIAASTTQAGFLAEETVGLAGAMASLRIQPEQARGVILRLFSDFDKAVSENGSQLEKYANTLGVTTREATRLWESEPEQFFDKLLQGLGNAENLNAELRELGITETRESNVLQRLAGNYDTYAASIQNASNAYRDGTFLSESYSRVADDIASRVQILINSIQNLLAKAGQSITPILGPVLGVVTTIVQGLEAIPAPILGLLTTVTLLAGGFALLVAGGAALVASGFAVRTALAGLTQQGGTTVGVMQGLRGTVTGLTTALGINAAAARANSITLGTLIGGARGAQAAQAGLTATSFTSAGALSTAGVAARGFGAALLATPVLNIVAALSIAIPLIFALKDGLNAAQDASNQAGRDLVAAGGGLESFREALIKDTEAAKGATDGMGQLNVKVSDAAKEAQAAAKENAVFSESLGTATGASDELYVKTSDIAAALKDQTLLVGENSKAWVANALYKKAAQDPENDPLGQLFEDDSKRAAYEQSGIDIRDAINAGMGKDGGVAGALETQYNQAFDRIANSSLNAGEKIARLDQLEQIRTNLEDAANAADAMGGSLTTADAIASALGASTGEAADATGELASETQTAAQSISALFDVIGTAGSYTGAMDALYASLEENGTAFDNLSAGGRANMEALGSALEAAATYGSTLGLSAEESMAQAAASIGVDVSTVLQLLQQIAISNPTAVADLDISKVIAKYKELQAIGAATGTKGVGTQLGVEAATSNLARLKRQRDSIQSQVDSAQASAAPKRARAADSAARKQAADAKKLADAIKTTAEYARDLGSAMKEAFDKRFGVQQSVDEITTKFQAMRDRIAQAAERMAELRADLSELAADRNVLQIQLGVATDYGDTARAGVIQAQLQKNSIDQAAKQSELAKATAAASTELEGNTAAAIENRAAVLGLIQAYQGQIEAFAATGASAQQISAYTKQLQGQFEQQLTQLGYNANSVRFYASTFDTLTAAVNNVPTRKEVTITADNSQAMSQLGAVGSRISGLSGQLSSLNAQIAAAEADVAKQTRAQPLIARLRTLNDQLSKAASGPNKDNLNSRTNAIQAEINAINARLNSGNYASGGLITGGPRPANRGVDNTMINAQYGEGVVNLKGMSFLGVDGLNAINNQRNPFPPQVVYVNSPSTANSGTLVVELSPIDRQLLADGKHVTVQIGRNAVANATNGTNLDNALRGANG